MSVFKVIIGDDNLIWENEENEIADRELEDAENGVFNYIDDSFKLSDGVNNYGNTPDQIMHVKQQPVPTFVDLPGPDDIAQGEAGDCWFLSSLCAFVNQRKATGMSFLKNNAFLIT